MNKITTLLFALLAIFTINSCGDDADFDEQQVEIAKYIADEGLTAMETSDGEGIWYAITTAGTGIGSPTETSEVTVHYEGRLLDGTKFDSSYDRGQPLTIGLSNVITGWKRGIPKFKKGDIGKLIIPSKYAYGSQGSGQAIPGNAILVFDIELIDFD